MLLWNEVPLDKDLFGGTNALGHWVSLEQLIPGTHLLGQRGGDWVGPGEGQKEPRGVSILI